MVVNMPTRIFWGKEELANLAEELKQDKVLIVTGKSQRVLKTDVFKTLERMFNANKTKYITYSNVETNPTKEQVDLGVSICQENNCTAVIGFGGGSVIDVAKAISFAAVNNSFWNFIESPCPDNGALKLSIITTSAGTGSEINSCAVITHENKKMALVSDSIIPKNTFIIPELMTSLPLKNTYYQLLDCMYHAIEGYLSVNANEYSMSCSEQCIRICLENLNLVMNEPNNENVREKLAVASIYSGLSDTYGGCLSIHSLGHAICAYYPEILHGEAIALISCKYYEYMQKYSDEKLKNKFDKLNNIFETSLKRKMSNIFAENLDNVYKLFEEFGNKKLADYEISRDEHEKFVRNARETVGILFENDPVNMSDEICLKIFNES